MLKKIWEIYKIQLFVSLALTIVLIATNIINKPVHNALIILGAFMGTFFLDLDYIVYAYFLEPEKSFSKTLQGFFQHRDLAGALNHIYFNKNEVKEKTLNSVLFQIVLAGASLLVVSSTSSLFIKALVLSTFANSIYKMAIYYFDGKADEWFWALKKTPSENTMVIYGIILFFFLAFSISLF
jgi:hypothetical protein